MIPFQKRLPPVYEAKLLPSDDEVHPPGEQTKKIQEINAKLDEVKTNLDFFDNTQMISARRVNHPYQFGPRLQKVYNSQHVSNAWLKMYEMANMLNLRDLADSEGKLYAFCNAELPGSFILALHHYCEYNSIKLDWVASSLMPKEGETMLPDSYDLYKNYSGQWIMDDNMTGDVTSVEDQKQMPALVEKTLGRKPMLYTSDIGGALKGQYNDQEKICLKLQYGQAITALSTLEKGGTAILKQFTFATPMMQSLHVVLSLAFEKLVIVKPLTSRASNSENYVIGIGFKSMMAPDVLDTLIGRLEGLSPDGMLVNLAEHESFMKELASVARILGSKQTAALYKLLDTLAGKQQRRQYDQHDIWVSNNPISPLIKQL